MAFIRAGHFKTHANKREELIALYSQEAIPEIRVSEGNIGAILMERHGEENSFVALTLWRTKEDAERYDESGKAANIISKVKHTFIAPPTLVTYEGYGFNPLV